MDDMPAWRIDIDDSRVLRVTRDGQAVTIALDQCRNGMSRRILVELSGVTREDAEHYVGHGVTAPHPGPDLPLDYIEYAEQAAGHLELGGYRNNDSWFVWRLTCTEVRISG